MNPSFRLVLLGLLLAAPLAADPNSSLVTAVFSRVSNGYQRQKLPDGTFKREHYALAKGVFVPGVSADHSIDAVKFPQVAKLVAQFLALQNYYLAEDAKSADLLLMITWGTTAPFSDSIYQSHMDSFISAHNNLSMAATAAKGTPDTGDGIQSTAKSVADAARDEFEGQLFQMQMFEDMRRKADEKNAQILGYVDEINNRENFTRFAGAGSAFDDLNSDLESERYYVIIAAYDFRTAKDEGKRKLLWATRVSIQRQGNKFNETLAAMLTRASRYFGQDSGRLLRQYQPEGKVNLGELQVLGVVSQAETQRALDAEKRNDPHLQN
jgi:hypothetical protein